MVRAGSRRGLRLFVCAVGLLLMFAANRPIAYSASGTPTLHSEITPSPPANVCRSLTAVAPVSGSDVWAVGQDSADSPGSTGGAVVLRRTNSGWRSVPGLDYGATAGLFDVTAVSATNVWAVGTTGDQGLVLHWNGHAWARIYVPVHVASGYQLSWNKVIAFSGTNMWLSGWEGTNYDEGPNASEEVLAHFTGKSWRIFSSYAKTLPGGADGFAVDTYALGPSELFTVGLEDEYGLGGTYFLEWNGTKWQRLPIRHIPDIGGNLGGLGGTAGTGLWLGGSGNGTRSPQIARWSGKVWTSFTIAPIPNVEPYVEITSLHVASGSDAWAVGAANRAPDSTVIGLAEHWNGTAWQRVPSGQVLGGLNDVNSVDGHVWAVGGSCNPVVLTGPAD